MSFLGGPLYFLSELRVAFERTLEGQVDSFTLPENAQLFVAIGAAMLNNESRVFILDDLQELFERDVALGEDVGHIPALFANAAEKRAFDERHGRATIELHDISVATGPCFLGIDAGSTTTKATLINSDGELIYTWYGSNGGSPVDSTIAILRDLYAQLPDKAPLPGPALPVMEKS